MNLSVIIPVYNVEAYLETCLESILSQKGNISYEIILVNDGSTDKSKKICKKYSENYEHIRLVSQANQGVSVARNVGLTVAAGEYVYFLDSDDFISEDMFETCYAYASANDLDIVTFDANVIYDEEELKEKIIESYDRSKLINRTIFTGKDFFVEAIKNDFYRAPVWLYMVRRQFLLDHELRFLPGVLHEDEEFTPRCFLEAKRVGYLVNSFFNRRVRRDSIMTGIKIKKRISGLQIVIERLIAYFIEWKNDESDDLYFVMRKRIYELYVQQIELINRVEYTDIVDLEIEERIEEYIKGYSRLIGKDKQVQEADYFILYDIVKLIGESNLQLNPDDILNKIEEYSYIKDIEKNVTNIKINRVSPTRFMDSKKVIGIYGLGKHTEWLLDFYKQYIGEIKAEIIFIDSFKESYQTLYNGRSIINIRHVNNIKFDLIVISSFSYEKEMYSILKEHLHREILIIRFYEDGKTPLLSK